MFDAICHRSRYYFQCNLDERLNDWPDDRFWDELRRRTRPWSAGAVITSSIEKSIAPLPQLRRRAHEVGRLLLAGDAAHIVPPTGAKGLNLAASDVRYLAEGLIDFYLERRLPKSRPLLRACPHPRLESGAVLLVDDESPAPFPRRQRLCAEGPAGRTRLSREFPFSARIAGREHHVGLPH